MDLQIKPISHETATFQVARSFFRKHSKTIEVS